MCGKFTQMLSWAEVHAYSGLLGGAQDRDAAVRHDVNDQEQICTPMRNARVIRLGDAGRREVVPMRWSWPDRRSPAPVDRPKHMHAKSETLDRLPTFRDSFAKRRGIVAVKTFNVGEEVGRKVVQHVLTPVDGKPLGIAVIYDEVPTHDGELLLAFVMCTTEPCPIIAAVTDRMPAILPPEHWAAWLGETLAPPEEIKGLLVPYAGDLDMKRQAKPPRGRDPGATNPML